jgi:hypothetical protein
MNNFLSDLSCLCDFRRKTRQVIREYKANVSVPAGKPGRIEIDRFTDYWPFDELLTHPSSLL